MRPFVVTILTGLLVACGPTPNASLSEPVSESDERGSVCTQLGTEHAVYMQRDLERNYSNIRVSDFYSSVIEACVHTEVVIVGIDFEIRDLTNTLLRDGPRNMILHCDQDGADSVIIEAVKKHRGVMLEVPYAEFLDDGFGGPPRALKTPDEAYTREQCQRVFDKWMAFLK